MTILVDSDILIEVSRATEVWIVEKWNQLATSDALILFSPISAAELWAGARPSEHNTLAALFEALACASADAAIGRQAGDYMRQFRKSQAVELGDAMIAATAVASGAALWTRNRKHYPMKNLIFSE